MDDFRGFIASSIAGVIAFGVGICLLAIVIDTWAWDGTHIGLLSCLGALFFIVLGCAINS